MESNSIFASKAEVPRSEWRTNTSDVARQKRFFFCGKSQTFVNNKQQPQKYKNTSWFLALRNAFHRRF